MHLSPAAVTACGDTENDNAVEASVLLADIRIVKHAPVMPMRKATTQVQQYIQAEQQAALERTADNKGHRYGSNISIQC